MLLVAFLLLYNHQVAFVAKIKAEEQVTLRFEKHVFEEIFRKGLLDVKFLTDITRMHLEDSAISKVERLKKISDDFMAFSRSRPLYWQLRYIEPNGKERARINRTPAGPEIVTAEKLQDKSARAYFKRAIQLEKGAYISKFDLNVENGRIEIPFKPTFRIVASVLDLEGRKLGLMAINYFGGNVLEKLGSPAQRPIRKVYLVNEEGFWLKGALPEVEWGFVVAGRENKSMPAQMPSTWEGLKNENQGQLENDKGLFTFAIVDFSEKPIAGHPSEVYPVVSDDRWKIISHIPPAQLSPSRYQFVYGAVGLFLFFLSVMFWQ